MQRIVTQTQSSTEENKLTQAELPPGIQLGNLIGSGSYGLVYDGMDANEGNKVAIKKIPSVFNTATDAKRALREIKILRMTSGHPNIVKFKHLAKPSKPKESFEDINLIFEHAETNLDKIIHSNQFLSTLHIKYFIYQILCATQFLHSSNIIHRDLKPQNILINEDCSLKICDFGLARPIGLIEELKQEIQQTFSQSPESSSALSSNSNSNNNSLNDVMLPPPPPLSRALTREVVTRWYRAPEIILLSSHYGPPIDMWSIGCILAELLEMQEATGINYKQRRALFPGNTCFPLSANNKTDYNHPKDQLNLIFNIIGTPPAEDILSIDNLAARKFVSELKKKKREDFSTRFRGADKDAIDLLDKLLEFNPAKRLTAKEALAHPFLKTVLDETLSLSYPIRNAQDPKSQAIEDKSSLIKYYQFELEMENQIRSNSKILKSENRHSEKPNNNNTNPERSEDVNNNQEINNIKIQDDKLKAELRQIIKNMKRAYREKNEAIIRDLIMEEVERDNKDLNKNAQTNETNANEDDSWIERLSPDTVETSNHNSITQINPTAKRKISGKETDTDYEIHKEEAEKREETDSDNEFNDNEAAEKNNQNSPNKRVKLNPVNTPNSATSNYSHSFFHSFSPKKSAQQDDAMSDANNNISNINTIVPPNSLSS